MNKISWPYIGTTDAEMGSMKGHGNYRDFMEEGYSRLDSLTPEKFTVEDTATPTAGISGGRRFILSEDPMESNMFFDFLFNDEDLPNNSNVLIVSDNIDEIESCATNKHNVFCLSKQSDFFSDKIVCEAGDSKYYKFNKKFDSFYLEEDDFENLKLSFLNLNDQIKSISFGYIKTNLDPSQIKKAADYGGETISSLEKLSDSYYKVSFNNLKNSKIIGVLDRDGNTKAAFICDIADSIDKKFTGLQAYSNIRNSFGLLFPYKRATDVSYHMGTVSYPIDIIFLDDHSLVKKIEENIQPGSPGLFSCSEVRNVLEIKGGMSSLLDIKVGDAVFVDSAESLSSSFLDKNTAIKTSNFLPSSIHKYGSVSIKVRGVEGLRKEAFLNDLSNVAIIDLDTILGYDVKIHKVNSYDANNVRTIIGSGPKTISDKFENLSMIKYASTNLQEPYCLPATSSSFSQAFRKETKDNLEEILKFNGKIVLATKNDFNWEKIGSILNFKTKILFNKNFPSFEVLRYHQNDSLYEASRNRYLNNDLYFLNKKAGIPVPKEDLEKAKVAEDLFKKTKKDLDKLLKNLKKNLSVYQTIQSNKNRIKNSKYEYNESVKRNTEILKKILTDIKKALQIMNEIKDISNTIEIISAVATSTMRSSKVVKEIFDLSDSIENDDFITQLTQKTGEAEKMFLDLNNSNQRMVNYINTDILGVLVITP
jgi:uncharacterized membrane protein (UPF0127 family)